MCGPKGKEEETKERRKDGTINIEIEREKIYKDSATLCAPGNNKH